MASVDRGLTQYSGVKANGGSVFVYRTNCLPAVFDGDRGLTQYSGVKANGGSVFVYRTNCLPAVFDGDRGFTSPMSMIGQNIPPPANSATYKMTGWYAIGAVWESWESTGVANTSPPSGHALTFVSYVLIFGGSAN